jgi:flagellar biogenesis protein FliO
MEMKKYLFWILACIITLTNFGQCFAVDAVSPELQQSLKINTSEPNILSIIFSLLVVIFLIYITGLIYTKLNIAGARAVKQQLKNYDLSKVIVISTTQLGQNKNLHVIEINNQRLLIGSTPESINLIKELESTKTNEKAEKPAEEKEYDAISMLYRGHNVLQEVKGLQYEEKQIEQGQQIENLEVVAEKEFNLHKKYL